MTTATLLEGNCLDQLRTMPDESVHAIVTDPPYGLANTDPTHVVEALTRWATGDREFIPEGRGFMGKAWDAFVPPPAVWDECLRVLKPGGHLLAFAGSRTFDLMTLSIRFAGFDIRDSIAWLYGSGFPKGGNKIEANGQHGWGTALKPAFEPVVVARKPFPGTVAANVLEHGTGALNIDAARVEGVVDGPGTTPPSSVDGQRFAMSGAMDRVEYDGTKGRWPANVMLDESQAAALDEQTNTETSRFFYVAKAPKSERPVVDGEAHPTVKPLALMRQLIKLVTPPGGIVVDPFAGSGTTLEAAHIERFDSIGIEMTATYWPLIRYRIERAEAAANAATPADDEALFSWEETA